MLQHQPTFPALALAITPIAQLKLCIFIFYTQNLDRHFSNFLFSPQHRSVWFDTAGNFVIFNEIFTFNIYWTFIASFCFQCTLLQAEHFSRFSNLTFWELLKALEKRDDARGELHLLWATLEKRQTLKVLFENRTSEQKSFDRLKAKLIEICCGRCWSRLCNFVLFSLVLSLLCKSCESRWESAKHTSNIATIIENCAISDHKIKRQRRNRLKVVN